MYLPDRYCYLLLAAGSSKLLSNSACDVTSQTSRTVPLGKKWLQELNTRFDFEIVGFEIKDKAVPLQARDAQRVPGS
jgi:hypothetical protein